MCGQATVCKGTVRKIPGEQKAPGSDAIGTAAFYADRMDYRDPNVPEGIQSRSDFERYLRILFRQWPEQQWVEGEVLPHARPGCFTVSYHFRFANSRRGLVVEGRGIDRIEFEGDLIRMNWVYLNAEQWPYWIRGLKAAPLRV